MIQLTLKVTSAIWNFSESYFSEMLAPAFPPLVRSCHGQQKLNI